MKNLLKLLTLFLALTLTSCNKDDDAGSPVAGKWKYTGLYNGNTFYPNEEDCYSDILTFNEDLTGNENIVYCDDTSENSSFTWATSQNDTFSIVFALSETRGIIKITEDGKLKLRSPGVGAYALYEKQ